MVFIKRFSSERIHCSGYPYNFSRVSRSDVWETRIFGESVFAALIVFMLIKNHIPVVAAVSKRTLKEFTNENGQTIKSSIFEFAGFRIYILDYP